MAELEEMDLGDRRFDTIFAVRVGLFHRGGGELGPGRARAGVGAPNADLRDRPHRLTRATDRSWRVSRAASSAAIRSAAQTA